MASASQTQNIFSYVIRNTMLPQVTDLWPVTGIDFRGRADYRSRLQLSGLGYTLFNAVNSSDYNLIMGITLLSIVGIATASLLIDLSYPLFDPRSFR